MLALCKATCVLIKKGDHIHATFAENVSSRSIFLSILEINHILSPVTDNCPTWISGRRNDFMTDLHGRMLPDPGIEPAHPTELPGSATYVWKMLCKVSLTRHQLIHTDEKTYIYCSTDALSYPYCRTAVKMQCWIKHKKRCVRPAKTQTSLGILQVRSESWLSAWRNLSVLFRASGIAGGPQCVCDKITDNDWVEPWVGLQWVKQSAPLGRVRQKENFRAVLYIAQRASLVFIELYWIILC